MSERAQLLISPAGDGRMRVWVQGPATAVREVFDAFPGDAAIKITISGGTAPGTEIGTMRVPACLGPILAMWNEGAAPDLTLEEYVRAALAGVTP